MSNLGSRVVVEWRLLRQPDKNVKLNKLKRRVLDFLLSEPKNDLKIAEALGYRQRTIQRRLWELRKEGYVSAVYGTVDHGAYASREALEQFVAENKYVQKWLGRLRAASTRRKFLGSLFKYVTWGKEKGYFGSADQLIEKMLESSNKREVEQFLDWIEEYVHSLKTSERSRDGVYTAIRSFYRLNRADLPQYTIVYDETVKKGRKQQPITLEELRKIILPSQPREKAIILTMLQGGLDCSTMSKEFNYHAWPQLKEQLGADYTKWHTSIKSNAPIRFDFRRPKTDYECYTFIDRDALDALQQWLIVRETTTGKSLEDGEPIFITNKHTPINPNYIFRTLKKMVVKAGLEREREVQRKFKPHELRDTFKTTLRHCGVDEAICEFFLGHNIDKMGYDKSPWVFRDHFREQYMKHESMLNILSSRKTEIESLETKLKNYEDERVKLTTQIEKMEAEINSLNFWMKPLRDIAFNPELREYAKATGTLDKLINRYKAREFLRDKDWEELSEDEQDEIEAQLEAQWKARNEETAEKPPRKTTPMNNEETFESKLVSEDELIPHLNQGWNYIAPVNGKFAIRKARTT